MELFATLLLAHLIADFPLQTNCVFELKVRHWTGIFLHVAIHVFVTALLINDPLRYWPLLAALGAVHFATDWFKLRLPFRFQAAGFILDQIAHVLALVVLAGRWPSATGVLPATLLRPAIAYALIPAALMFLSVLAVDIEQVAFRLSDRLKDKAPQLVALSQVAGWPLILGVVVNLGRGR